MRSLRHITQRFFFSFGLILCSKFKTEIYDMFSVLRAFLEQAERFGMPIMQTSRWRCQGAFSHVEILPSPESAENPRICCGQCDELFRKMKKSLLNECRSSKFTSYALSTLQ